MRLGLWISLQDKLEDIRDTVETNKLVDHILEFVSTVLSIPENELENKHWVEVANLFFDSSKELRIEYELPMFSGSSDSGTKVDWDYSGRNYFAMIHPLCKEYGWTIEYVEDIDHNKALALLQEIEVDRQLKREWDWGLSEVAYQYNSATKKSSFSPLERPVWMKKKYAAPTKTKIKKSTLPVGTVMRFDESEESNNPI